VNAPELVIRSFPRGPLLGAGALLLVTFALVIGSRLTGTMSSDPPRAAPVAARDLRFEDRADGTVAVIDGQTNAPVAVLAVGTNGFVRATMRGLARDRRSRGIGPDIPFHLAARADGALTLDDPATGRQVNLEAFGHTNAEAFARFLDAPATASASAPTSASTPGSGPGSGAVAP
jgi:putative photosynthetic complex assembly protein